MSRLSSHSVVLPAALALVGCASSPCAESESSSSNTGAGSAGGYTVVDTDQTTCYDDSSSVACSGSSYTGQDGAYEGEVPAYEDNGDGTVSDLSTGLMWTQDPGDKMTFDEALDGAETCATGGYDDWRLPTIKELYSLILFSGTDPSGCADDSSCDAISFIDEDYFVFEYGDTSTGERMIDAQYASDTVYEGTTMGGDETVFGVNFADGRIKGYGLTDPGTGGDKTFFVQYVRANTEYGINAFVDNGDDTVWDEATGLMWTQQDSGALSSSNLSSGALSWEEALALCEGLSMVGHDDWRLPDVKELQSIVDYSRSPQTTGTAALDPVFEVTVITDEGGDENFPFYWSSTTHASVDGSGAAAAYVAFGEALGWMQGQSSGAYELMDVHGAGAQRSDPKAGDAADHPYGHGPQGDVIRIENHARCVR